MYVMNTIQERMIAKGFNFLTKGDRMSFAGADKNDLILRGEKYEYVYLYEKEAEKVTLMFFVQSGHHDTDCFALINHPTLVDYKELSKVIDKALAGIQKGIKDIIYYEKKLAKALSDNFGIELNNVQY